MRENAQFQERTANGAEWIGRVPDSWTFRPFFSVAHPSRRPNKDLVEKNLLSLSYGRIISKDIDANEGLLPESFETYQIVEPDDMIFRLTDLQNDQRSLRTALVMERGIITSAYLCVTPKGINPRFFAHAMRAADHRKVFYSRGDGLRQTLKYDDLKWLWVPFPPLSEQQKVVDFIDRETAKIDAVIGKQRALVRELEARRRIAVLGAVTKGLTPSQPRNGGSRWLSDVPAHWDVARLNRVCVFGTGDGDSHESVEDGSYPFFLRSQNVASINRWNFDCEAVMTAGDGAGVGKVFHYYHGKFDAHQRVYVFRDFRRVTARFFYYYLRAVMPLSVLSGTASVTIESLRRPMLSGIRVTIPSASEQQEIVDFCERQDREIDALIARSERLIELSQERRAALITAAVTGQLDITSDVNALEGAA